MTSRTTATARRRKGEGSISRFHEASKGCPPVGANGLRPEHPCKANYRARQWVETMTGERKRKTIYGKTEQEVIKALKKLNAEEERRAIVAATVTVRDWMRPDAEGLGITNWWTEYAPQWKVNTRKGYKSRIEQTILPALGSYRLDKLTPDHVVKMYAAMRRAGLSDGSVRNTHMILSRALTVAMRRGKVARNVCKMIDPPSVKDRKKPTALAVSEAWRVLRLAGDDPRFWLALLAGLRQGEALALRWSDMHESDDLPFPHLVVREALSRETGVGLVFDSPKSNASTDRIVPLIPPVAERVAKARAEHYANGGTDEDLVFRSVTGHPRSAQNDWQQWSALLKIAAVEHRPLHAARHTTAHLLEDCKVPARVAAEILGHSTVQVTHGYQAGNLPALREALKALGEHMAAHEPQKASA